MFLLCCFVCALAQTAQLLCIIHVHLQFVIVPRTHVKMLNSNIYWTQTWLTTLHVTRELPTFLFLLPMVLFQFQQTHQRGTTSAHHQRLLALQLAWTRQKKNKGQNSNSSIESAENLKHCTSIDHTKTMPTLKKHSFFKDQRKNTNTTQPKSKQTPPKENSPTHSTPTTPPSEAGNSGATRPPWKYFSKKESEYNSISLCFYL